MNTVPALIAAAGLVAALAACQRQEEPAPVEATPVEPATALPAPGSAPSPAQPPARSSPNALPADHADMPGMDHSKMEGMDPTKR